MATILDSLVGSLARKLQDIISEEFIMILGVKEELEELKQTVNQIQCFLNDAEQRRIEESAVNHWLSYLKYAMYEADDIIQLARIEGTKLLAENTSSTSSPFRKSVVCPGFSVFSCLPNIRRRHEIAVRIKKFRVELENNLKLGKSFLKLQNMQPKAEVSAVRQLKTWQLVEPNLVGKEITQACRKLTGLILRNKEKTTYKLGIVGTGGVGKTTLVQKIYNDHKIKGSFNKQAWICVSQEYSAIDLLKGVLRNLEVHYQLDETVGELGQRIAIAIRNKSFFLILDDVWQHEVWTNLLRTPLCTAATAIVVVTTRNDTVARAIGVEDMHRVELMPKEVGWELLWKSMNISEETNVQNLRDVGMEIVQMCAGLPLAIKVIASVLMTKERTENEWRKVVNRTAWSQNSLPDELRGALYLSYDELSWNMKQCFLYCALYPEDFSMHRDDLVRFWVAEGFVEEKKGMLLEDTAEEYFYELIYRNLLQPNPYYVDHRFCKMHDLLRQLAQYLWGEEYYCGDPLSLDSGSLYKVQHVSFVMGKEFITSPDVQKERLRVRTLTTKCKALKVDKSLFKILPKIRVLDLTDSTIQSSPDCFGGLIHLRYLDLHGTDISYLPDSICCLINLQILNLERCNSLHSIPVGITQLGNLRRLGLYGTPINQVPKGIGRLKCLNDLSGFPIGGSSDDNIVRVQNGWDLKELDNLLQLRKFHMIKLERASHGSTNSPLRDKKLLKRLYLCCTEQIDGPYSKKDAIHIEKTFDLLIPPSNLEKLVIIAFFGLRYPTWFGSSHLPAMQFLDLKDCKSCVHLPPIGELPNLKYLKIKGATAVTKIGTEFVGYREGNPISTEAIAFPNLETLVIHDMPNWEVWTFYVEEDEAMEPAGREGGEDRSAMKQDGGAPSRWMQLLPRLKKLDIMHCPKLRALPCQLGQQATSLKELQLRYVDSINMLKNFLFLSDILVIATCEGLERVTNIPLVKLLYAQLCPNLRHVERLNNLHELFLTEDMQDVTSQWLPGLQEQHQQLHGEDLDVYNWT